MFFSHFMKWNWRPLSLKSWPFEGSEDIMTKFKTQALHIIRIKYRKVATLSHSCSLENCHLCTNNKIFYTILLTAVQRLVFHKNQIESRPIYTRFKRPKARFNLGCLHSKLILNLKYYSPTITHDKIIVYDFCVLWIIA